MQIADQRYAAGRSARARRRNGNNAGKAAWNDNAEMQILDFKECAAFHYGNLSIDWTGIGKRRGSRGKICHGTKARKSRAFQKTVCPYHLRRVTCCVATGSFDFWLISGSKSGSALLRFGGFAIAGAMTHPAISIDAICKTYDTGKRALDNVSFQVERGSIFGLLGPNGAGKSTLINILAGLVRKTSGSAKICGFDIDANPRNAKASIGIVPQEIMFDPFFTPREALELQAGLYGVPKAQRKTMDLLRAVRLEDKADAYARTLSGGMKRRLLVAKALVHSPPVIILDEPTAGVDIELRQQLWDYVVELNKAGTTVVLTTHYLEEAEQLCDRIAIINHGKLIANKPTRELVGMAREKAVVLTLDRDIVEAPSAYGV